MEKQCSPTEFFCCDFPGGTSADSYPLDPRAYLRGGGGGVQGVQTPPEIFRFFLKSEGNDIEKKRKKKEFFFGGGGGYLLTYFWG